VIDYIYYNEWSYHYSITKITNLHNKSKLSSLLSRNISVPESAIPKKNKLDKALS
jgi:hypothetical protein